MYKKYKIMNSSLLCALYWNTVLTLIQSTKYIKILTEDRKYELMLVDDDKDSNRFVFVPSSKINGMKNVFIYDTIMGGIKTESNVYISRKVYLYPHKIINIEPELIQNKVNDWRVIYEDQHNRIGNSENIFLKKGSYSENTKEFLLEPDRSKKDDPLQRFAVIEIPVMRDEMCDLLNLGENCPLLKERETDILNAPILK